MSAHSQPTKADITFYEIGMVGLGVMGRNLLLNIAEHGFSGAGYDTDPVKLELLRNESRDVSSQIKAAASVAEFVGSLRTPRAIIMLVPAGAPVDAVIRGLLPHLQPGDLLIDGGNSYFRDTELRGQTLAAKGIQYLGVGISGGEHGARHGPSLMPGGPAAAYERVRPIFEAVAARAEDSGTAEANASEDEAAEAALAEAETPESGGGAAYPGGGEHGAVDQPDLLSNASVETPDPLCVAYMGPGGAGHYVKMVHNGIEYALMQLIAESYDLLARGLGLGDDEIRTIYARWNHRELRSYLMEITAAIFDRIDERTGKRLIDVILDEAGQKGTGKWTSQSALDLGVPAPTINAAVMARDLSAFKTDREAASKVLHGPERSYHGDRARFLYQLRNALYVGMAAAYGQGMAVLAAASREYHYELKLDEVARIWRGGCIIRSAMLDLIWSAYRTRPTLPNLLMDPQLGWEVMARQADLRAVVRIAAGLGTPVPALMASLSYYDGYRSSWLPANLIQAQRDYFGAHTYERVDEKGVFHTQWSEE
jgi:6-phosphogluconate dehydrogenase